MKEVASDLFLLRGFPPAGFNIYVIRSGDQWVLVDTPSTRAGGYCASSRGSAIEGKAEEPLPEQHRDHIVNRLAGPWWRDHHPVARRLRDGEQIAGFTVIESRAHPGPDRVVARIRPDRDLRRRHAQHEPSHRTASTRRDAEDLHR